MSVYKPLASNKEEKREDAMQPELELGNQGQLAIKGFSKPGISKGIQSSTSNYSQGDVKEETNQSIYTDLKLSTVSGFKIHARTDNNYATEEGLKEDNPIKQSERNWIPVISPVNTIAELDTSDNKLIQAELSWAKPRRSLV